MVLKLSICNMVHTYVVPTAQTNQTAKKMLQVWLALIGHHFSEVSFHSRMCSEHFINGQKTKDSIPEIFPWQRHSVITAMTNTDPHNVSSKITSQDTPQGTSRYSSSSRSHPYHHNIQHHHI